MDFPSHKSRPVAVVFNPVPDQKSTFEIGKPITPYEPQFNGMSSAGFGYYRFIHYKGRRFLFCAQTGLNGSELLEVASDRLRGLVNATTSYNKLCPDRNRNGVIEPAEMQESPNHTNGPLPWWDDELNLYVADSQCIWRIPFEGFDPAGIPIYDTRHAKLLLTSLKERASQNPDATLIPWEGAILSFMVDRQQNIYVLWSSGADRIKRDQGFLDKGHRLAKFSPQGKLLWEYRNIVATHHASW